MIQITFIFVKCLFKFSCGDTCQILIWYLIVILWFDRTEKFVKYGMEEIDLEPPPLDENTFKYHYWKFLMRCVMLIISWGGWDGGVTRVPFIDFAFNKIFDVEKYLLGTFNHFHIWQVSSQ